MYFFVFHQNEAAQKNAQKYFCLASIKLWFVITWKIAQYLIEKLKTSSTKVGQYASTPWPRRTMYVCFSVYPKLPHGTQLCFLLISKMLSKAIRLFSKIQNILKTNRPTDRPIDMTRYRCFLVKHKNYIFHIPYSTFEVVFHFGKYWCRLPILKIFRLSSNFKVMEVVFHLRGLRVVWQP